MTQKVIIHNKQLFLIYDVNIVNMLILLLILLILFFHQSINQLLISFLYKIRNYMYYDILDVYCNTENTFALYLTSKCYIFCFVSGYKDVSHCRWHVRRIVAALSSVRRLQLVRQGALQGFLVLAVHSRYGLHEQRNQPNPLQCYVGEVQESIQAPTLLW